MVDPIFDYQFRVILIGDSTVGKSSLLRNFTDGTFAGPEVSDPTVGVDFFARIIRLEDGTNIKLQLWDTAGQERFRSITKSYYRNSVGVLLLYDICNRETFLHIPAWLSEARRHIEPHPARFILVGCKLDLANNDGREVSEDEARLLSEYHQIPFVETSARMGVRVEEAFAFLTRDIYQRVKSKEYKLQDGWDGVKRGYFNNPNSNNLLNSSRRSNQSRLRIGEPMDRKCC